MSATSSSRGSVESGALALQRVLALEGRDVLSRVELAASELDRFALSPALCERIAAIREAVSELDSVLDKIERLGHPLRRERAPGQARIEAVFGAIRDRIAPALAARGVVLDATGDWPSRAIAIPAPVLERLVLLWLRTAILALAGGETPDAGQPIALVLEGRERDDAIELALRPAASLRPVRFQVERSARIELDVALAEWEGLAVHGPEADPAWTRLVLPPIGRRGDA